MLIHNVDLNRGFGPESWPAGWTAWMLGRAVRGMNDERHLAPLTASLHATDTGREFHLGRPGGTAAEQHISGPAADSLAWLMGRSDGATLVRDTRGKLPAAPSIYYT